MTSLSTSTLRSYRTAVNSYTAFCHRFGFPSPFPTSEPLLAQFAAFLAERNLSYGSIQVYLSGIRFTQITLGFPDPAFFSLPRLEYVLRGICRASPGHVRPQRLPVSPQILRLFFFHVVATANIAGCSDVVGCLLYGFLWFPSGRGVYCLSTKEAFIDCE